MAELVEEKVGLFEREREREREIVGPAILSRLSMYGMSVITMAFAGHLGDLQLSAISIASTVVVGFNFGILANFGFALSSILRFSFPVASIYKSNKKRYKHLYFEAVLLLSMYIFATPILKLTGQTAEIAELAGSVTIWFIPQHFAFVFLFPLQRFLQSHLRNMIIACVAVGSLLLHVGLCWGLIFGLKLGLVGAAWTLNFARWVPVIGQFVYACCGWCPQTWTGFSREAFSGLWEFLKLSAPSGIMLWSVFFLLVGQCTIFETQNLFIFHILCRFVVSISFNFIVLYYIYRLGLIQIKKLSSIKKYRVLNISMKTTHFFLTFSKSRYLKLFP
ncbi:hypothetical protein AMTRI_Chr04g183110 [Amborella trichopoda]